MRGCILLFLAGLAAGSVWADDVVFRSDVSLVRVDAQVLDSNNRAITGLNAEDFILREGGREQPIRNFASENMPVDVLLLLDVSASMRPHVQRIGSAAHQALRVLGPEDRVAIMVFDRATRLRLPLRSSRDDVEREFERLLDQETFNGGTDITRALLDAAQYIGREGRRDARRAIVILTDDQTERDRDEARVSRALAGADAVLMALLAPDAMGHGRIYSGGGGGYPGGGYPGAGGGGWPQSGPMGGPLGGIILRRRGPYGGRGGGGGPVMVGPHTRSAGTAEIARRSGGDSLPVDQADALENTLARIRQRYALHFYLPPEVRPGEERAIEVDLSAAARRRYPDAEVRYRREYYAPGGGSGSSEPVVVTSTAPAPAGGSQPASAESAPAQSSRGVWRRVEQRDGPPVSTIPDDGGPAPAATQQQPAPAPAAQPADSAGWPKAQPQAPAPGGGWRRVKPGEQP